jgi:excisionase family DNA binding protein
MEKLLTDRQVADHLGMNVRTLRRKIQANTVALNYIPQGRQMLFKPDAVERYVKSLEIVRDGSGKTTKVRNSKKLKVRAIMTDEEAQAFFEGIARNSDGDLLSNAE